ncbi:protein LSM14 homolog B [Cynoglossus semilaevis]|uniref:LSM family member 14B n=1 Tax=Cynoglossus semilaevis TaxID=244447 RepID=A0A3P8WXR1_CYNSE|nr:protein LSM14 homolog B [Cynoglossus semilaevis]
MSSEKPFIGCKIGLISRAQNRYEGILYTIDKVNSTVVLAKVRCFGTEGRLSDRPSPPKDDVYDYITFRGSDIKDITLYEVPGPHLQHGLPPDPAIVQSSIPGLPGVYSALNPFSSVRMPGYNQLAANPLLQQQYAAAPGLGPVIPGLHMGRPPMVEKAVQTLNLEAFRQGRSLNVFQEDQQQQQQQQWPRRNLPRSRAEVSNPRRIAESVVKLRPVAPVELQETRRQYNENRPPPRRRQGPRRRDRSRGQLLVTKTRSITLRFDTDFDFDSSNAQFIKEKLEVEGQRSNVKGALEVEEKDVFTEVDDHFRPRCYDKTKSFFDNFSSDNKFRLTWAEERKRNLETFGVPGRFLRGRGFRGRFTGQRGRGRAQVPLYRDRGGPW